MTGFGTDSAVLHPMLCVLIAFIAAELTRLRARLYYRPRKRRLERGLARKNIARSNAHISAVKIKADTADETILMPLFT